MVLVEPLHPIKHVHEAASPARSHLFQDHLHHTHSSGSTAQKHLRWPNRNQYKPAESGSLGSGLCCTLVVVEHWGKSAATSLCSRARKLPTLIRNQTKTQIMMSFDLSFALSSQQSRKAPEGAIIRPSNLTSGMLIQAGEKAQSANVTSDFPLPRG